MTERRTDWHDLRPPIQLLQEFLFIHRVLERLASVDRDHRHFFVVEPLQFGVTIDIDFLPAKHSGPFQSPERILHHLAQVTLLSRIDDDLVHARYCTMPHTFPACEEFA